MKRLRLNWVSQFCVLTAAIACGSSKNGDGVGANNVGVVGGSSGSTVGGVGFTFGGEGSVGGDIGNGGENSYGGEGTAGNGSGSNAGSGNGSGTGSTSSTDGGSIGNGGNAADATGGAYSVDVKLTGGTGNSVDYGSGGGNSIDVGTGGGYTIDVATGGGNSIDLGTGGGNSIDLGTGGGNSIDLGTGGGNSIDLGTGGGASIDHPGCFVTTLGDINVYVTKDANPSGADTEGRLYVGGNLTANGYSVGAKAGAIDCTKYSLVVGGNVALTGGSVRAGQAAYAGTSGTASATNFDCGGLTRGRPIDFTALKAEVEDLSLKMSQLPVTDCTVTGTAPVTIKATNPKFSVCNIDAATLTGSSVVNLNFPAGSSVAVNVSGTNVNWTGAAVCLNGECADSAQANAVVWNFYEATKLSASGIAIEGSVLAPFATLGGGGGHIAGQVIVQYLTGGLEYHPYMFSGCITWPTKL